MPSQLHGRCCNATLPCILYSGTKKIIPRCLSIWITLANVDKNLMLEWHKIVHIPSGVEGRCSPGKPTCQRKSGHLTSVGEKVIILLFEEEHAEGPSKTVPRWPRKKAISEPSRIHLWLWTPRSVSWLHIHLWILRLQWKWLRFSTRALIDTVPANSKTRLLSAITACISTLKTQKTWWVTLQCF